MNEIRASRIVCLVMALFPALWGIFSLLNNIAGFSGTAQYAVAPLLTMQDTYQLPGMMWRAITLESAPYIGLILITATEASSGLLACIGLLLMLKNINDDYAAFSKGKAWTMLGAACAVLVWGIGFMVVAGDWFMSWQAKNDPLATQLGGMIYALPCILTIIVLLVQKEPQSSAA